MIKRIIAMWYYLWNMSNIPIENRIKIYEKAIEGLKEDHNKHHIVRGLCYHLAEYIRFRPFHKVFPELYLQKPLRKSEGLINFWWDTKDPHDRILALKEAIRIISPSKKQKYVSYIE